MSTETEVGHLGDAVLDENVARRQVAVHEALVREVHHAVADVQGDSQRWLLIPHIVPGNGLCKSASNRCDNSTPLQSFASATFSPYRAQIAEDCHRIAPSLNTLAGLLSPS